MSLTSFSRHPQRALPLPQIDASTPLPDDLPVAGGWGYTRESACIITDDRPPSEGETRGLDHEALFIVRRLSAELSAMRIDGDLVDIRWKTRTQDILRRPDGTPAFDHITVTLSAYLQADLDRLAAEDWATTGGTSNTGLQDRHERMQQQRSQQFINEVDFWFDVSHVKGIRDDAEFTMTMYRGSL